MREALDSFRADYRQAFAAHLRGSGEAGLRAAYELGRSAMLRKLSVLDLADIHHEVLFATLADAADSLTLDSAAAASSTFFLEVLSTYEMVQRGLAEAHETARLEQQHAERLRRLADASVAISAAGTLEEIVRRIPEHATRVLGAASARVRVELDGGRVLTHACPPDREPSGVGEQAALVRRNGSRIGGLEVFAEDGGTFTSNEESVLTQLAGMAGIALENAELYERERLVAETLQRRLLPGELPDFAGASMACRYLPGWRGSDIGGDWYDAMVLPDGRLALVVGDVMGKGIGAAAGMGQLRIALRAYAVEGHVPAVVIRRLDDVLGELGEDFATVVYLVYDPAEATLRYANAGHPPPLLVSPDGSPRTLNGGLSPPLGGILGEDTTEGRADVEPGSTLVMYTDGLIERRGSDIGRGIDLLVEATAAGDPSDIDGFCDHLLEALDAGNRGDDIALLAVRLG